MKFTLAFVLFGISGIVAPEATKIDNHDIQEILTDQTLFQQYFNCIMEWWKCTPGGQHIKDNIPEHVKTGCVDCAPERKELAKQLVRYMIANRSPEYTLFEKKYDPKQVLRKLYAK